MNSRPLVNRTGFTSASFWSMSRVPLGLAGVPAACAQLRPANLGDRRHLRSHFAGLYLCRIIDRRFLSQNRRFQRRFRAEMGISPLQALDMASFTADGDLAGVTHHSDHGSNCMLLVYTSGCIEIDRAFVPGLLRYWRRSAQSP